MNILAKLAVFSATALLAACAAAGMLPPQAQQQATITLTRTVCFGFCPDYSVTITSDGEVTYVGRRFVNVVGEQHASAPRAEVQQLLARFDAVGFDGLRSEYRAQVTDLPTYTLVLERNGRRKSVVDYGGTGAGMPEAVRGLQDEVDRVAGTARWVLRNGEPVRTPSP